jgi:hypothetical protein
MNNRIHILFDKIVLVAVITLSSVISNIMAESLKPAFSPENALRL